MLCAKSCTLCHEPVLYEDIENNFRNYEMQRFTISRE